MNQICVETDAIWRPAGVRFDCHRITSNDRPDTGRLVVTIDDQPTDEAEWQPALGWITFTAEGPKPTIHLSRAAVEALLGRTELLGFTGSHELVVGRALGRALSHELGHYLLRSRAHTPEGLMRATWPSGELFGMRRKGFELTTEERQVAAEHLRDDQVAGGEL